MIAAEAIGSVDEANRLVSNQEEVCTLQRAVMNAPRDIDLLRSTIASVIGRHSWMDRLDPHQGTRFLFRPHEFVKFIRSPRPDGLQSSEDDIRRLLGDGPERVAFEMAIDRGRGAPPGNHNAAKPEETNVRITNICETGNQEKAKSGGTDDSSYAIRRLARERSDLLERVQSGELSAHRAMVEAGFRKEKTPYEQSCFWWGKMSREEKERFLTEKNQQGW